MNVKLLNDNKNIDNNFIEMMKNNFFPEIKLKSITFILTIFLIIIFILQCIIDEFDINNEYFLNINYNGSFTFNYIINYNMHSKDILLKIKFIYKFFSALFFHANFNHIAYNLFNLILFGSNLEYLINNRLKYFILLIFSGFFGNLTTFIYSYYIKDINLLLFGFSTCIYGIYGGLFSYIFINYKSINNKYLNDNNSTNKYKDYYYLILITIIILLIINNKFVHIMGLLFGFLFGIILIDNIDNKNYFTLDDDNNTKNITIFKYLYLSFLVGIILIYFIIN